MREFGAPPSLEEMEAIAVRAFGRLPPLIRQAVEGVAVRVEDFPDEKTAEELDLDDPFQLTGLYVGTPLAEQSVTESRQHVDVVFLYRRPILDEWCDTGQDLEDLVWIVLTHEIGHHLGFSDDDMESWEAEVP